MLDYCDHVYFGISGNDKDMLRKLQNCSFRSILNFDIYTHTADTHATLNMDQLDDQRKNVSVQMYKYINCPGPTSCRTMFTYISDCHEVNTRLRSTHQLVIPRLSFALAQCNIRYFGPKIWKDISEDIKSQATHDLFKEHIYTYSFKWKHHPMIHVRMLPSHEWVPKTILILL